MKAKKVYAGIGSMRCPSTVRAEIREIAQALSKNFILQSGGAKGCDEEFEQGALAGGGEVRILLPWQGYNQHTSSLVVTRGVSKEAHARAVQWTLELEGQLRQLVPVKASGIVHVQGMDLTSPVDFVVCWSEDRAQRAEDVRTPISGTGFGILEACKAGIPVFNLANPKAKAQLQEFTGVILDSGSLSLF